MIGRMLKWSFSNSLDLFGRPKNPFNPGIFRRPCTWMGASHTSSPIDLSVTHRYERTHQATLSILTPICRGSATHSALTTTYIVHIYHALRPRLKKLWCLVHSILNQDDHQMIRSSSSVFITALQPAILHHVCLPFES